jgi:release factor glutamine methyltransferase
LTSIDALLADEIDLLARHSSSARADALLLLAHVLRRPREWLVSHGEAAVCAEDARAFRALCERRSAGVPVAYLVGSAWFFGREFLVNESVLVPRPETEHLIDESLRFIRGPTRVLDIGTGCGAIACTIAAETHAYVDAADASSFAIAIANENARRLGVTNRCRFHHGDLVEPVRAHRYDVVIANLPYVPTADLPRPPDSASFEPREALDGGPDGLALYRRLLAQLPPLLKEDALILLECAAPTIRELQALVQTTLPNFVIEGCIDYAGLPRYIRASSAAAEGPHAGEAASESGRSQDGGRPENRAQARARSASQASAEPACGPEGPTNDKSQVSERTRAK